MHTHNDDQVYPDIYIVQEAHFTNDFPSEYKFDGNFIRLSSKL